MEDKDYIRDIRTAPDAGRVIQGLRDTGYTFNAAIADIIDNSISADATRIDIKLNLDPQKNLTIYIADNGNGMNRDELINAMRYGSDERPNPASLGKFGLGLKTASTSFCKKLSLISCGNDGEVRKVQWDLDYVAKTKDWNLKEMDPSDDEIDILEGTSEGGTGTLVVWQNIDRLSFTDKNDKFIKSAYTGVIKSLQFHLRVTYQRFLDPFFTEDRKSVVEGK